MTHDEYIKTYLQWRIDELMDEEGMTYQEAIDFIRNHESTGWNPL